MSHLEATSAQIEARTNKLQDSAHNVLDSRTGHYYTQMLVLTYVAIFIFFYLKPNLLHVNVYFLFTTDHKTTRFLLFISRESTVMGSSFQSGDIGGFTRFEVP